MSEWQKTKRTEKHAFGFHSSTDIVDCQFAHIGLVRMDMKEKKDKNVLKAQLHKHVNEVNNIHHHLHVFVLFLI